MPCSPLALLLLAAPLPAGELPYSVPAQPWPEALGKHRARVRVEGPAEAVRLHLPWRRRDLHPEAKRILIVDAATGKTLRNVAAVHLEREFGDLVFQPETAPGDYFVYYLPYTVQGNWGWYGGDYLKPEDTADPAWRQTALADPARLPEAQPVEIQARTEFSRFDPMEVIATAAETQALLAAHPEPFLLFAEDRRYPIRMTQDLPLRWIQRGPGGALQGEAERDEHYAFQVGVFAARQRLEDLKVTFTYLRGPATLPARALTCFNSTPAACRRCGWASCSRATPGPASIAVKSR
ncbi:MAG: hypothetical protein HYU66_21050 [Armatimonadetes bacterium]|nr:hypothetical protein [Armatimonadota bacterium]